MAEREDVVPVFVPALVALLLSAEEEKGEPLTEEEVIAIRDEAACVMMPAAEAAALEESRGYPDIAPEDCWEQWQQVRLELAEEDDEEEAEE